MCTQYFGTIIGFSDPNPDPMRFWIQFQIQPFSFIPEPVPCLKFSIIFIKKLSIKNIDRKKQFPVPTLYSYIFKFTYRYSSNFEVFALLFKYRYGTYPDPDLDPNVEYGTDPEGH